MKIKILNLKFDVIEVDVIEHGSDAIGQVRHIDQVILIKKGLSKERKKIALIHEILHSVFEQLGFQEQGDDEHLIDCLATAIYQVSSNNKDFFKSL